MRIASRLWDSSMQIGCRCQLSPGGRFLLAWVPQLWAGALRSCYTYLGGGGGTVRTVRCEAICSPVTPAPSRKSTTRAALEKELAYLKVAAGQINEAGSCSWLKCHPREEEIQLWEDAYRTLEDLIALRLELGAR